MKSFLANTLAKWFKSFPHFGRLRFQILYLVYRLWPGLHIRHKEWDFVLNYLPPLHDKSTTIRVLDVGCARSLFMHELAARGYWVEGIDLEQNQDTSLHTKIRDITLWDFKNEYDFITCISVLEHIGNNGNGGWDKQVKAVKNMTRSLKVGGRLLLTCPTKEFAKQGHKWHGFIHKDIYDMIDPRFHSVIESTERAGQICMAIERVA